LPGAKQATPRSARLIQPELQVNIRGGCLPKGNESGKSFRAPSQQASMKPARDIKAAALLSGRNMEIRQITEDYSVAPQIEAADVTQIAAAGFKSIISNRPDTEDGAVPHDEIEAAARAAGLEFRYIPVISGQITLQNVEDQAAALDELPRPVLAYCRSGARCTNLYNFVQQQR
jgi:uncharacterized protein (TIGR01244 family)